MAMVSGKFSFILTVTMLVAASVSGCSSIVPVERQALKQSNIVDTLAGRKKPVVQTAAAPLPRQAYDSAGKKIPYVPMPNPYISGGVPVPEEAKSVFVVANGLLQAGNLKGAGTKFRMMTGKYPSLSGPWVKLGVIAEKLEKYDEAIEYYKKATSLNRNNVNAYITLGLVQRRQGYFSDAQSTYLEALAVWKDFPEAHLNLAILYDLYLNRALDAQKHYEAFYFLGGEKNKEAYKWLVEVKQRTGIDTSFIDIPPTVIAKAPGSEVEADMVKTDGSD